ncbi:rRNA-processing protein cgr1 [Yamadazyma tenuis]|uniref:Gluconolactonase n=1 Tax=Candida tenuis (strain ATCC 10573 / BCRC 21748 / CBS 615 / JCM 9827 / NBRC 10315 / NRRL Y-1498 / VKM Y-70) TaxID=590646 RepID=G3B0H2_CANTC|nr:Gluconolactonase [Yamadazyma tenuis ATCC 10573]EGV65539.1 Gluconolactonase [Yamadazyma tenuis ATCC 10573]WEJ94931.1 rRNA-processing protein cgr1 [Yamadazyma tenuis]
MLQITVPKSNILLPEYSGALLEGVTYNKSNNSLLWVEIEGATLHRYFFDTAEHQVLSSNLPGDSFGTLGLTTNDDKVVLGNRTGVVAADFSTQEITPIVSYPPNSRTRSNDGKIDPHGNLIVGTMSDFPYETAAEGSVFRLNSRSLKLETWKTNTTIANGLGWSPDLTKFYWTDSGSKQVYVYDYDEKSDQISNEKVFFDVRSITSDPSSAPDGMCVSEKGNIFVAVFNQAAVLKLNSSGEVVTRFNIPAPRITCVTIGGKNGDEMFVTTAGDHGRGTKSEYEGEDLGGHLFWYKLEESESETQFIWGGDV